MMIWALKISINTIRKPTDYAQLHEGVLINNCVIGYKL